MVGEAPGDSEDVLGQPFVGPAGHLLDQIIHDAMDGRELRLCFTNLVCCIPKNAGEKGEPSADEIRKCAPRLREFLGMAKPKLIVRAGKLSSKWLTRLASYYGIEDVPVVDIHHPAFILRAHVTQQQLLIQEASLLLNEAFDERIGA